MCSVETIAPLYKGGNASCIVSKFVCVDLNMTIFAVSVSFIQHECLVFIAKIIVRGKIRYRASGD